MQFPPPGHNDDFIEWSLGLIDETINFGSIPEIKKIKRIGRTLYQRILTI